MEELVLNVVFYVFAIGAVVASLAVALSTNIIRSAFALLGVLFAVAGFYAFMRADFIVAAQIIIYVGGILVLIIFAVMLTHRITDVNVSNESAPGPAAVFAVLCVLFALCVIIATWKWERAAEPERVQMKATIAGAPHDASARVGVSLARGDGTGMPAAGEMRDQFMLVTTEVTDATVRAKSASVEIQRSVRDAKSGKDGAWTRVGQAAFAVQNGIGKGSQRLTNLEPARYRWIVTFADETGVLAHGVLLCPGCRHEGEPRVVCATANCKDVGKVIGKPEEKDKKKCAECKSEGQVRTACVTVACARTGRAFERSPRMRCPVCSNEVKVGTACTTPGCVADRPLEDMVWSHTGKEWTLEAGLTRPLGRSLMNRYLLAFEVVSVLLLAALVGAAYIARKEVKEVA